MRSDLVEAFVGNAATLTYRLLLPGTGAIGLIVQDGSARFTDLRVGYLSTSNGRDQSPMGRRGSPAAQ